MDRLFYKSKPGSKSFKCFKCKTTIIDRRRSPRALISPLHIESKIQVFQDLKTLKRVSLFRFLFCFVVFFFFFFFFLFLFCFVFVFYLFLFACMLCLFVCFLVLQPLRGELTLKSGSRMCRGHNPLCPSFSIFRKKSAFSAYFG